MCILKVEDLEVTGFSRNDNYAETILINNINLKILSNKITCLIGESGSGKSIFSKTIAALLPENIQKTNGSIFFKEKKIDYSDLYKMRGKSIFYTPQNAQACLNPIKKILNQFTDKKVKDINRLKEILHMLNFSDPDRILNSYPFQLSGGENQRCLLAISIIKQPELLILDEPTSGLDEKTQYDFIALLKKISRRINLSVLLITHRLKIVQKISDFTYVIFKGCIVDSSVKSRFINNPAHEYTRYIAENISFF